MLNVMPILKGLAIESIMKGLASPANTAPAKGAGIIVISLIPGFISLCFFSYAEFSYLLSMYDAPIAAFITAITFASLTTIVAAIGVSQFKKDSLKKLKQQNHHGELQATIASLIETISAELEEPIKENPKTAVLLASLAGYIAGDRLS